MTKLAVSSSIPNLSLPSKRVEEKKKKDGVLLSKVSARDLPWDTHKAEADIVAGLYDMVEDKSFRKYAERIRECSKWLEFTFNPDRETGELLGARLKSAHFCRCMWCPLCQWRRSLMWRARFFKYVTVPDFPKGRWIHVTWTVENVPLNQLGETLNQMNRAWERMIQRKSWPAEGFIRSTEITRAKNDFAHPHFHGLLFVPSSYFGRGYILHKEWVNTWREVLRADYDPSVRVQAFKLKKTVDENTGEERILPPAEILKYAVKPCDLMGDGKKPGILRNGKRKNAEWIGELTRQTKNRHLISTGGILKDVFGKGERETNDELLRPGETPSDEAEELERWWFLWFHNHYRRRPSGYMLSK